MDWPDICRDWEFSKIVEENGKNELKFLKENFKTLLTQWKTVEDWKGFPLETVAFVGGRGCGKSMYTNLLIHCIKYNDNLNWLRQATKTGLIGFSFGSEQSSTVEEGFLYPDEVTNGIYIYPELLLHGKDSKKKLFCILHLHQVGNSDETQRPEMSSLVLFLQKVCTKMINIVWNGSNVLTDQIEVDKRSDQVIIHLLRGHSDHNVGTNTVRIEDYESPLHNSGGKLTVTAQQNNAVKSLLEQIIRVNAEESKTANIMNLANFLQNLESTIHFVNGQNDEDVNTLLSFNTNLEHTIKCLPTTDESGPPERRKSEYIKIEDDKNQQIKTLPTPKQRQKRVKSYVDLSPSVDVDGIDKPSSPPRRVSTLSAAAEIGFMKFYEDVATPKSLEGSPNLNKLLPHTNDVTAVTNTGKNLNDNVSIDGTSSKNIKTSSMENVEEQVTSTKNENTGNPKISKDMSPPRKTPAVKSEELITESDSWNALFQRESPIFTDKKESTGTKSIDGNAKGGRNRLQRNENLASDTMRLIQELVDNHEQHLESNVNNFEKEIYEVHRNHISHILTKYDNDVKFDKNSDEFTVFRNILTDELNSVLSLADQKRKTSKASFQSKVEQECTEALMKYERDLWDFTAENNHVSIAEMDKKFSEIGDTVITQLTERIRIKPRVLEKLRAEMISINETLHDSIALSLDYEYQDSTPQISPAIVTSTEEQSSNDGRSTTFSLKRSSVSELIKSLEERKEDSKSVGSQSEVGTPVTLDTPKGRVKYLKENLGIDPSKLLPGTKPPNQRNSIVTTLEKEQYD